MMSQSTMPLIDSPAIRESLTMSMFEILNSEDGINSSIEQILHIIKHHFGFDAVGIRLQDGEDFPYHSQEGFSKDFLMKENSLIARNKQGSCCRNKDGSACLECTCGTVLMGKADPKFPFFTEGGSAWTNDSAPILNLSPEEDPRVNPRNYCFHEGYQSTALIPIRKKDEIVGLLQLNDKRKNRLTLGLVTFFEALAQGIGVALIRIQHETARQKAEDEIRNLNKELENKVMYRTAELTAKHEALKSAQSQLVMREKLASVGQLAAGIAHELNNPIGFVMNNCHAMQWSAGVMKDLLIQYKDLSLRLESYDEFKADIEAIREKEKTTSIDFVIEDMESLFSESKEGFRRATEIIDSMRDFSRADRADEKDLYNINKGVETTLVIARNVYKYIAEVVTEFGNVPEVRGVPNQLNQVLLNIIVNAAHAIKDQKREGNGSICIKTYVDGNYVCCEVSDDGLGIPEELVNNIFDPFFTTKGAGVGTGLGLSISYDIIVERHKGDLSVKSEQGKGTTFTIKLPMNVEGNEVSGIS